MYHNHKCGYDSNERQREKETVQSVLSAQIQNIFPLLKTKSSGTDMKNITFTFY